MSSIPSRAGKAINRRMVCFFNFPAGAGSIEFMNVLYNVVGRWRRPVPHADNATLFFYRGIGQLKGNDIAGGQVSVYHITDIADCKYIGVNAVGQGIPPLLVHFGGRKAGVQYLYYKIATAGIHDRLAFVYMAMGGIVLATLKGAKRYNA